jgi:hypothetical protein
MTEKRSQVKQDGDCRPETGPRLNDLMGRSHQVTEIILSENGQMWSVNLECYPEEQLIRVRKKNAGTVLLGALKPSEVALARLSATGLRLIAEAHMKRAGLWPTR